VRWLAAPLWVLGHADRRSPAVRRALARVAMAKGGSDIADVEIRNGHPGYRHVPLRALLNLIALQRQAWRDAPRVTQPALVVHARNDHTCPVAAAIRFYERLGSARKRLVVLEESFHVVTVDRERAAVQREILAFLATLAAPATAARAT
jgi:esterase/lipase